MFILPHIQDPTVRRFYLIHSLIQAQFISAVWLPLWLKTVRIEQVGWIDGVAFLIGWLSEVPSGYLADRYGRKELIILSGTVSALGLAIQSVAGYPLALLVGQSLLLIGYSMYSGAGEALLYDSLPDEPARTSKYQQIISCATALGLFLETVSIFAGAYAYKYTNASPFLLQSITFLSAALLACGLTETARPTLPKHEKLNQLYQAIAVIKREGRPIAILAFGIGGIYYAFSWSFIRPAMANEFTLTPLQYAWVTNLGFLFTFIFLRATEKPRTWRLTTNSVCNLGFVLAATFLVASLNPGIWGALLIPVMVVCGNLATPWISVLANRISDSSARATTLSLIGALIKLPFCLIVPIAGKFLQNGAATSLFMILGVLIFLFGILAKTDSSSNK